MVTDVLENITTSIFMVEVSQTRKVSGYTEKGRKGLVHGGRT
jgi:hypothetical protein